MSKLYRVELATLVGLEESLRFDNTCACDGCLFQEDFRKRVADLKGWVEEWAERIEAGEEYE